MSRSCTRTIQSLILLPACAALLLFILLRSTAAAAPALAAPHAPQAASITLTKTVGTGPACAASSTITVNAGTLVTFCYTVRNTGSESHLHHWLDDSELGVLFANVAYMLDPGETTFVTQTQVITQSVTNIGFWQADLATANYVSASSPATVTVNPPPVAPSLLLTKTVGTTATGCASGKSITVMQGTPVTYCYRMKNTGDVTLNVHRLADNRVGILLNNVSLAIAPGATRIVTRTAVPAVSLTNLATWTAWLTGTAGVFVRDSDSASVTVTPRVLAAQFTKSVGVSNACATTSLITVAPGTRVVYCYKLKNTGNVSLTVHKLTDNRLGTILNNATIALAPNQSTAITRAVTANITTTNVATWTAAMTSATGLRITATDSATVRTPRNLKLDFRKTVGTDPASCSPLETITVLAGEQVVYCYTAKNTGNVPLKLHTLTDGDLGVIFTNKPYTLAVNASLVVTAVDTPLITTTATATWTAAMTSATGLRVSKSDGARVNVIANPTAITLTKTVGVESGPCATTRSILVPPGTNVYYCYTVHNTGPVALPKHQLYDDDIDFDILPPDFAYPLQPDEVLSTRDLDLHVSRAITKTTVNFALWQSYINDVLYAQASASATVFVAAAENQAQLTVGASGPCPGGVFFEGEVGAPHLFCLRVQNSGGVTLTHHLVELPALGINTTLATPLAPGAAMTVTAAELPALGTQPLTVSQAVTATVISTYDPDGAPFSARAETIVTLLLAGDAHHTWLPTLQKGTPP